MKGTGGRDFFQTPHSSYALSNEMCGRSNNHISTTFPRSKFDTCVSHYINSTPSKKPVYLYKWFLIRVGGDHLENGTRENGVQVALEGYTTSDLLDHEKFRTAPIEFRIEKCKLRTVDGKYILLMDAIDEQNTYDNGFPIQVIHLFLTGFPFNWDKVISTCYDQPSLNTSVLLASKEREYAWQENDETLNSDYSGIHMEDMGTGKTSLLELKGKRSKAEENMSKVTSPRESLVRYSKKERHGFRHIRSLKRLKCGNSRKKSESNVSSARTASVKKEDMTPEKMYSGTKTSQHFDRGNDLTESGIKLSRNSHFAVPQEAKDSVKGKKNALKYHVFETMKETREYKKQIDCGSFFVEAKLTQPGHSVAKESGSVNQTNGNFASAEDSVHNQINNDKSDQSAMVNLHLEQFKNNFSSGEQTLIFQIPVSEFPDAICKAGKLISRDGSHTMRHGTDESSQASRGESCGEIAEVAVKKKADTKHDSHRKEIINTRVLGEECKNFTQFPSNPDFRVIPNKLISSGTDGKGQLEVDCSTAESIAFDFICMKEDVLSASAENKPSSLPEDHLNNDVNKPVKQVNMSGTERGGQPKNRTRCTDQPPELSKAFVCNQITVNDGVRLKCNHIDSTFGTNRYQVASKIENGMASKHRTEICDGFIHTNEDVLSASAEKKPLSLPENLLNNDVNKHAKKVNKSGTETRRAERRKRQTDQSPEFSEAFVCNWTTVNDGVMLKCNGIDQVASEIEHGMASQYCAEIDDDFIHMKEDVFSVSEENKLSSLTENHLNNDANKTVKQMHKPGTMRRESSKNRTKYTYQLPEAFVCHQTSHNDDAMLKCNDIAATSGTNPYQVASEIEHGMVSKHCTGIGKNCQEGNGDGEEGSVQNQMTITEINMQTQTSKRRLVRALPPPLPPRRVHTTPEEVSKAFGLKTSRSGRLLVPPLAHWCNQAIAYDMDGGIIAILDASSQRNKNNDSLNFTPPEQKDAIRIQKKLCNAANKNLWTPKRLCEN